MRRVLSATFVATFLLIALAAPAAAQTPIEERRVREDVPVGSLDFTLPSDYCGFELLVEDISGRITYVFITEDRHGNLLERLIFHTVTRYTNLETGESFERRFDSVGNFLTRPDGTATGRFRNDVLAWYLEGEPSNLGPGVWLIDQGRGIEELDANGNVVHAELEGEVTDVCAALS